MTRKSRAAATRDAKARSSRGEGARLRRILDALEQAHPEATCALTFRDAYELLVATILSAQCTDQRVNAVTPRLFEHYPSARHLAQADPSQLEELIRSTGFYRAKARSLLACARALVERHEGQVPREMPALVQLPGVGRKTANVVLGHAFQRAEGMAVDTHVLRVANRLGLADSDDADEVERQLLARVPRERWTRASDLMIFHGRKICHARRPACDTCPVWGLCPWPDKGPHAAPPTARSSPAQGRSRPGRRG